MAAKMDAAEQREQLIQMASYWEKMAQDRALLISKHPELAIEGEPDEEKTARRGAEFSQ
ncbi:hypothetical protein LJR219_004832 [Phenylobacterium sp. LjRoot219]|uniref:hypothetical protein n=1 Tax=Phenylobacterium sp. LjRoot219 TaxID=3342283 RepID=UPI003ECD7532